MSRITHTPRAVLATGGAGFIGSNLLYYLLSTDSRVRVVNLDQLTYAGNLENLEDLRISYQGRYRHVCGDIADLALVRKLFSEEKFDTVIHLAAESHVDRSIETPLRFVQTNVMGTAVLLYAAQEAWKGRRDVRFHHLSTDEVYGSLEQDRLFAETTAYNPSSPYSASKAASDHLVRAWHKTYGLPITISNCSNNYGPYQFPEKFLPLIITHALADKPLPIYGDGRHVRDWLYVEDHCRAIDCIIRRAESGAMFNIGGGTAWTNIDVANLVCELLMELRRRPDGHYRELIRFVHDRPGHDRRYAIDASKIHRELGWQPTESFQTGLRKTIAWYLQHPEWIERIRSGKYQGQRLGLEMNTVTGRGSG